MGSKQSIAISCFIAIIATLVFSGPQTHDFQKISHNWKNLTLFNILVIF